jgi:iron complex transport system substrate-binding protein
VNPEIYSTTPRIVSLAPSATSILCAIGSKHTLVGVTRWCEGVAPVSDLPKLGDCWHMGSAEELLKLKPTLVIGSVPYREDQVAKLLEHPVNFLAMNPRSLSDIETDIRMLGGLVENNKFKILIQQMRECIAEIGKRAKSITPRVRVYCEAWPKPRISSPPWVAELVDRCGGEMVVPAGKRVTEKEVAEANPDLIVLAWTATGAKPDPERACRVAEWSEVRAIRNRKVFVVRDELLNTPGPPLMDGARELLKIFSQGAKAS